MLLLNLAPSAALWPGAGFLGPEPLLSPGHEAASAGGLPACRGGPRPQAATREAGLKPASPSSLPSPPLASEVGLLLLLGQMGPHPGSPLHISREITHSRGKKAACPHGPATPLDSESPGGITIVSTRPLAQGMRDPDEGPSAPPFQPPADPRRLSEPPCKTLRLGAVCYTAQLTSA